MVQPPAPPPGVPYVPPSAPPGTPQKQFPWVWLILGCGCLIVLIVVGVVAGGAWFVTKQVKQEMEQIKPETPTAPTPQVEPAEPPKDDSGGAKEEDDDSGASSEAPAAVPEPPPAIEKPKPPPAPPKKTAQPSREKAVAKVLSKGEPDWVTKVFKHSADWTTATIWLGPPQSEFVAEFDLRWNGSGYDIVAERPIEGP